jgi:hypothetical protein
MAEDTKDSETVEAPAPAAPKTYLLKNVSRGRGNRIERKSQPGRRPFVQRFAGGNIVVRRARPARISEAALLANLGAIKKAVAAHQIVVTTSAGDIVDLETFQVTPQVPASPVPNPPLDSAKNDKNENIGYDVPPTPEGTAAHSEVPELLRQGELPGESEPPPEPSGEPEVEKPHEHSHSHKKGKKRGHS